MPEAPCIFCVSAAPVEVILEVILDTAPTTPPPDNTEAVGTRVLIPFVANGGGMPGERNTGSGGHITVASEDGAVIACLVDTSSSWWAEDIDTITVR